IFLYIAPLYIGKNLRAFLKKVQKKILSGILSACVKGRKIFSFFQSAQVFSCAFSTHNGQNLATKAQRSKAFKPRIAPIFNSDFTCPVFIGFRTEYSL
ncbi:MAG: hypothetical protein JW806_08190, partial [Sedimentisphaerales bacterium]|nr:hypothetical protein [Sedimentisphaerales bacterium]